MLVYTELDEISDTRCARAWPSSSRQLHAERILSSELSYTSEPSEKEAVANSQVALSVSDRNWVLEGMD